jgi:hypothetical protein
VGGQYFGRLDIGTNLKEVHVIVGKLRKHERGGGCWQHCTKISKKRIINNDLSALLLMTILSSTDPFFPLDILPRTRSN